MSHVTPVLDWCEALYEVQASVLLLYGRALGLSHAEAEDVLHEVFQALLGLSEPPDSPHRYVVRAYRHRAINRHRSLWRRLSNEIHAQRWFDSTGETDESERRAMNCLATISAEQREVIVLKFWHDHTFEEIGTLLGISPHTAAGRYRYGLNKLRTAWHHSDLDLPTYERTLASTTTSILEASATVSAT